MTSPLWFLSQSFDPRARHTVAAGPGVLTPQVTRSWLLGEHGIQVFLWPDGGTSCLPRTPGQPTTIRRIWAENKKWIEAASAEFGISEEMILAVIATESRGDKDAKRLEPSGKSSVGLMQTLTGTADAMVRGYPEHLRSYYVAVDYGGDLLENEHDLTAPQESIACGTAYLNDVNRRQSLGSDPVLMYAAYNSGTARPGATFWGLVYYHDYAKAPIVDAMDTFVKWYNDAVFVLANG